MQRYGLLRQIPRKALTSLCSCCDNSRDFGQCAQTDLFLVAMKKIQNNLETIAFLPNFAKDMRRTEITNSIKEALKSVPYKMEARLYGSEARGDARPDSDIDLLILVDQPTVTGKDEDAIFAPLYQVELQSGVLINPLIIPKSKWGIHISPFYINVENESVAL